ncbi:hypothetical protein ACFX4N_24015 [Priestia sp. YIM B13551]|uniref:hypothetical protein n=1 Tax=Priestia sp. YIM B13551 TaxID=3366306 RepID=UPI00366FE1EB
MEPLILEILEPEELVQSDKEVTPNVQEFFFGGSKYILDLSKLKTQEDIINVIKHFSTRVELHVFDIAGIEQYVKPVSSTQTH